MINNFCPNCDAELDEQWGFSPYKSSWVCEDCGCLIESDEKSACEKLPEQPAPVNKSSSDLISEVEWRCPECDDDLDSQLSFSPFDSEHTCVNCGAKLIRVGDEFVTSKEYR